MTGTLGLDNLQVKKKHGEYKQAFFEIEEIVVNKIGTQSSFRLLQRAIKETMVVIKQQIMVLSVEYQIRKVH